MFGRTIPFAAGRQVFQYVESFRDAMLADARHGGLDRAQLERAADLSLKWLLQNGLLEQALGFAIDARDFDRVESITIDLLLTVPETYITDRLASVVSRCLSTRAFTASCRQLRTHPCERLRSIAEHNGIDLESFLPNSLPAPFASLPDAVVLTAREHAVLRALAAVVSSASVPTTAQIAAQLFVSTNTLKTQLRSLYRKLGADSRESAIRRAHELELL